MPKAQSDAPNYRASSGSERCGNCAHFMAGRCQLYDFAASADSVCDSWEARMMEDGKRGAGQLEYKAAPAFTMGIEDRTVTGIAIVHGNVDDGGDRSHPGLIGDGTVDGRKRVRFLWQHDSSAPPIATVDRIFEVARADLPPAVLLYAPDATGGTAVQRTYLKDAFADRVFGGVQSGALDEMSYAFELTRWDTEEMDERTVRNLYQANVFDFSDVNWGMNPATSATGLKGWEAQPFVAHSDAVEAMIAVYIQRATALKDRRAKEGRVLSGENRKRIADALEALDGAVTALKGLLAATEPAKRMRNRGEVYRLRQATRTMQQRLHELGVLHGTSG